MSDFEKLICALLRAESVVWPCPGDVEAMSRFLESARFHGVLPVLNRRFAESAVGWPEEILAACRNDALLEAMIELARRAELGRVLEAFHAAGIPPLVLKGSALAYTLYSSPALRPRGDTDLLIPPDARHRAEGLLRRLGYAAGGGMSGEFVSYQSSWSRTDDLGATHHLDIHWRINNSQLLAKLLSYAECEASATEIGPLGPHARGLDAVRATLFACMHRAGHRNAPIYVGGTPHDAQDRLIWLYDIHLLCSRMTERESGELAALAETKRLRAVCFDALECSMRCFATPIAPEILQRLAQSGPYEPSAIFLSAGPARQMLSNLMALEGIADRLRWLGETAFPPVQYMRQKYPESPDAWLPLLYARRGAQGLWRLAASPRGARTR